MNLDLLYLVYNYKEGLKLLVTTTQLSTPTTIFSAGAKLHLFSKQGRSLTLFPLGNETANHQRSQGKYSLCLCYDQKCSVAKFGETFFATLTLLYLGLYLLCFLSESHARNSINWTLKACQS